MSVRGDFDPAEEGGCESMSSSAVQISFASAMDASALAFRRPWQDDSPATSIRLRWRSCAAADSACSSCWCSVSVAASIDFMLRCRVCSRVRTNWPYSKLESSTVCRSDARDSDWDSSAARPARTAADSSSDD